jgi:hypothetical protein
MRRIAFIALGALAVLAAALNFTGKPASAFSGTPEEQRACRPDAKRFCPNALGLELLVLACLQENRQKISIACRRVLEKHGQ